MKSSIVWPNVIILVIALVVMIGCLPGDAIRKAERESRRELEKVEWTRVSDSHSYTKYAVFNHEGHDYIVVEYASTGVAVIHSESCPGDHGE